MNKQFKKRKVVYSFVVGDLFHWGHMLHFKKAKELGDLLVVGVGFHILAA